MLRLLRYKVRAKRRRFRKNAFGPIAVKEVRTAYAKGETQASLAAQYGVDRRTIQHLVQEKSYR